ncbi:AAA family ATPase [Embleya sp. NPDC059237]|uniref:helix-turn-helix transcriptional regulator n=1 Tax=Embleya sp. NPDC059237 TaxID=3346784 RepID=UPI00369BA0CC
MDNDRGERGGPGLVGRVRELDVLGRAWEGAGAQGALVVLVRGDAGIGKSRLVEEFAAGAPARARARVVRGGCLDMGPDNLPFGPFVTALRRLTRDLGTGATAALLPAAGRRGLARLLPELGDPIPESDPELGRARLFEEVLILLERAAEERPLLLVLEDLHWADRSTCELLAFLARNLDQPGVLVLGTHRPVAPHGDEPFAALPGLLARLPNTRTLDPAPLGRAEVARQLADLIGRPPDPRHVERVLCRSEGNPLFVEALASTRGEPDAGTAGEPPASLRELLLAGVHRVGPPGRRLLRIAAVAGTTVGHALLHTISAPDAATPIPDPDQAAGDIDDVLRAVIDARMLLPTGDGYTFRHTLIRDAVYHDLLPGERIRLHARCARALTADPALAPEGRAAAESAAHWYAAGDRSRAFATAWRAAGAAGAACAYAERLAMLERVLDLWDAVPDPAGDVGGDRIRVLELAADAAAHGGAAHRAETLLTEALHLLDPAREPERTALVLASRAAAREHTGGDALPDLERAVGLAGGDEAMPVRGRLLASLAGILAARGRDADADEYARDALRLGEAAADASVRARALTTSAMLAARRGELADAVGLYGRAAHIARDAGCDDDLLAAIAGEADALQAAGEHERAAEVARRGVATARDLGLARSRGTLLAANLAEPLVSLGRWAEAVEIVTDAIALDPPPVYRAWLYVVRAEPAAAVGAHDVAADALREVRAALGAPHGQETCLEVDVLACRLAFARDDLVEAERLAAHILADHDLTLSRRYAWPFLVVAQRIAQIRLAQTLRAPAATAEITAHLAQLRRLAAKLPTAGRLQAAHRSTFEAEAGLATWPDAIAAWQEIGQPHALADTLLSAATASLTTGNRPTAATYLQQSATLANQLGATPLQTRITDLSTRSRLPTTPEAPTPSTNARTQLGLTAREFEVLSLLAQGHTNRQIAELLFISTKTAGTHVSNILTKLPAKSRTQAATLAHHLNLFPAPHSLAP